MSGVILPLPIFIVTACIGPESISYPVTENGD